MIVEFLIFGFVFLFGGCIGSFLNCFIYRLEVGKSLQGRSFCPHCRHELGWMDLFPVFSFLALGGKCRYCRKKISIQYPIVEVATGIIFLLIFSKFFVIPDLIGNPGFFHALWIPAFAGMTGGYAGMTANLAFLFYVAAVLIVIFVYDLKHYLIPDKVLFPAIFITFLFRIFAPLFNGAPGRMTGGGFMFFGNYFLAAIIAAGFFLAIFLLSKGRAMGFGDVKLAILMGLLLGVNNVLLALFLSFLFGAIIGIILMLLKKKGLKSEIPFGPFLILGTFLAMFWGSQIISWYLNFFKI